MGSLWSRQRPPDPPRLDIATHVAESTSDPDIEALIARDLGPVTGSPSPHAGRLLAADTIAVVAWRKEPNLFCFDGTGRCIAVARCRRVGNGGWRRDLGLDFVDADGVAFDMATWSSQPTTLFGGRTAATVTIRGQLVGSYDGLPRGVARDSEGEVAGEYCRSGPVAGLFRNRLVDPRGELLAEYTDHRFRGATPGGRRYELAWIFRFPRHVERSLRALALAIPICEEVQAQKHLSVG